VFDCKKFALGGLEWIVLDDGRFELSRCFKVFLLSSPVVF